MIITTTRELLRVLNLRKDDRWVFLCGGERAYASPKRSLVKHGWAEEGALQMAYSGHMVKPMRITALGRKVAAELFGEPGTDQRKV